MSHPNKDIQLKLDAIYLQMQSYLEVKMRADILNKTLAVKSHVYREDSRFGRETLEELLDRESELKHDLEQKLKELQNYSREHEASYVQRYINTIKRHMSELEAQYQEPDGLYSSATADANSMFKTVLIDSPKLKKHYQQIFDFATSRNDFEAVTESLPPIPSFLNKVVAKSNIAAKLRFQVEVKADLELLAAKNPEAYQKFYEILELDLAGKKLVVADAISMLDVLHELKLKDLSKHFVEAIATSKINNVVSPEKLNELADKMARTPSENSLRFQKLMSLRQALGVDNFKKLALLERVGLKIELLQSESKARVMCDADRAEVRDFAAAIKPVLNAISLREMLANKSLLQTIVAKAETQSESPRFNKTKTLVQAVRGSLSSNYLRKTKVKRIVRAAKSLDASCTRSRATRRGSLK